MPGLLRSIVNRLLYLTKIKSEFGRKGFVNFFRKEDVPVKVGTYQLVRTRYVVATKPPPIYSESDTSSEESDSDSDNDQQVKLLYNMVIALIVLYSFSHTH